MTGPYLTNLHSCATRTGAYIHGAVTALGPSPTFGSMMRRAPQRDQSTMSAAPAFALVDPVEVGPKDVLDVALRVHLAVKQEHSPLAHGLHSRQVVRHE